ncbi:hypothetical protein Y1Q_0014264 [Alligator mississippiensis]|uniref:Uncharacterized protein n=1 Tax=Alligator mississippiensis TaxID=8496 RepID=A0A151LZK3_ALLMI|nr:hypothetical protein Y1Q_0014264 [Alligator mississippiensis]
MEQRDEEMGYMKEFCMIAPIRFGDSQGALPRLVSLFTHPPQPPRSALTLLSLTSLKSVVKQRRCKTMQGSGFPSFPPCGDQFPAGTRTEHERLCSTSKLWPQTPSLDALLIFCYAMAKEQQDPMLQVQWK